MSINVVSTGVFRFPNRRAAEIAVDMVKRFKQETNSEIKVIFNIFKDMDYEIYSGERFMKCFSEEMRGMARMVEYYVGRIIQYLALRCKLVCDIIIKTHCEVFLWKVQK